MPNSPSRTKQGDSLLYEFRASEGVNGWWTVSQKSGGAWSAVAMVFGVRRAEIVRDALSKEANVRV